MSIYSYCHKYFIIGSSSCWLIIRSSRLELTSFNGSRLRFIQLFHILKEIHRNRPSSLHRAEQLRLPKQNPDRIHNNPKQLNFEIEVYPATSIFLVRIFQ